MKAVYDQDARSLTRSIYASLRMRGLITEIEAGLAMQAEIEEEYFRLVRPIRERYVAGDYLGLLSDFLPKYAPDSDAHLTCTMLMDQLEQHDPGGAKSAAHVLDVLIAELETPKFQTPINLLVAVDVLFRLTIIPLRCEANTERIFRELLQMDVSFCGEEREEFDGEVVSEDADETAFWQLLSNIVDRWDLQDLLSGPQGDEVARGVFDGELIVRGRVAELTKAMFAESQDDSEAA
jgi:hypothetical protein